MNAKQRRTLRRQLIRECTELGFSLNGWESIWELRNMIVTAYAGEY